MRSTGQGVRGPSITHDRRRPPTGGPTERSRARPARLGWAIDCQKEGAIRGFARDTHRITFAARAEETSILQVLAGGRTTDATTRSCASRVFDGRPVMRPPWCPQHRWGGHFPYRSRRHDPPTCGRPGRGGRVMPTRTGEPTAAVHHHRHHIDTDRTTHPCGPTPPAHMRHDRTKVCSLLEYLSLDC